MRRPNLAAVFALVSFAALAPAQSFWTQLYPAHSPLPRSSFGMTYDSARHRTLMFGGYDGRFPLNETWQWDGMDWTQIQVAGPSARVETAIAFDSVRNVAVLFAGRDFSLPGYMQDTWEWNGTAWTQRFPAHVPPARSHHAMAFDPDRAMTVMFGGVSNQGFPADVWEWDGADWLQRTSSGGPGPRQSTALTYDPSLGGVILFGGDSGSTWRWDGAAWHQLLPPQSPYPRLGNSMVADFARRRIVLLGSDPTPDPFAWEWDGATWQTRFVTSPGPRSYLGLAYDSSRRETVLFGGDSLVADTWVYATPNPASSTSYGSGCPGSIGTPLLANARYSLPWIGDSFTMEVTNLAPATSVAILATGIFSTLPQSLAIFGMPGCDAFLVPAATQFVVANAGTTQWTTRIPNSTALAGAHIYQQAFALEPGANAAGIVVSNGVNLEVGIR